MNVEKLVLLLVTTAFLAGCGQPAQPPPLKAAPKAKLTPPPLGTAESAAPGAPPPPPSPTAVATDSAPSAPPPGQVVPGASTTSPNTDVLFAFRKDAEGRVRNDLEALQEAATSYDRRAGLSFDANKPAWPVMKDLSDLVKVGMLKALPEAPAGKKYSFDPKGAKVSLVNQ